MSFVIPIVSYLCLFLKLNCRRGSLKIIHVFCVKEMTNNFNDNSVCILTISECLFIGKPCTLSVNRAFLCISLDLVFQPKSPPMQCNVQNWIFLNVNLLHGKNCETLIYSHWKCVDFQKKITCMSARWYFATLAMFSKTILSTHLVQKSHSCICYFSTEQ